MYRIGEFLTPSERLEAMRIGGLRKLASAGLKPSDMDEMAKEAGTQDKIGLLGAALRTSVLIGAPLGAVWYVLSNALKEDSSKTKKMKATLDHYNSVVEENKPKMLV